MLTQIDDKELVNLCWLDDSYWEADCKKCDTKNERWLMIFFVLKIYITTFMSHYWTTNLLSLA